MAADLETLAKQFKGDTFKSVRTTLMAQASQARQLGAPEHFAVPATAIATEITPVHSETSTSEQRVRRPLTKEEKEALAAEGIKVVYPFSGETIDTQRSNGRKFWYVASSQDDRLASLPSITGDVAVDPRPGKFFLPRSNNLTLDQQVEMIAEYSHNLQRRLGTDSIEAVMGEAPDYTALAFAHLDATGERFFGQRYDYRYARTQTPTVGSNVALVGNFNPADGLDVDHWSRDSGDDVVFAAPLVVAKA